METIRFRAAVVPGSKRGRHLGTPTLNLDLHDVPKQMDEGVYACWVQTMDNDAGKQLPLAAALHYGPRPVFNDTRSCEVHVLDAIIDVPPASVEVIIAQRLRDVQDFESAEALQHQIADDITQARAILQ